MSAEDHIVSFESPPVVEVVCGVLFSPLSSLLAPHLGLLWDKFKPAFPNCEAHPPLAPALESPAPSVLLGGGLELRSLPPLPRTWFVHESDNEVIQVQQDRFLVNWRRGESSAEYPRFSFVRKRFESHLETFCSFLSEHEIGALQPLQFEMTYVNHVPQGRGFTRWADVGAVFPDVSWRTNAPRFLDTLESIQWQASFALPDGQGRLRASLKPAVRRSDGRPLMVLELTARGMAIDEDAAGRRAWFDLAHEWIVRGFADLTDETVQREQWGRTK